MKPGEKGYTLIELMIAITIMVMATGAAGAAIFQILKNTERNNDHITAVRQVENAGYWISRDAQMAQSISTNLTPPDLLVIYWTEWSDNGTAAYYSARYFFPPEDMTDRIGTLKRYYWSTGGANEYTLIAQYMYYNPIDDVANTSNASYQDPLLTVRLTALFEETRETREYQIKRRPNF